MPVGRPAILPDTATILARYLAGESGADIARSMGLTPTAVYLHLLRHAPQQWREHQAARALQRLEDDSDALSPTPPKNLAERATDKLGVARTRESARIQQWVLERLVPRMYGQHSQVDVSVQHAEDLPREQRLLELARSMQYVIAAAERVAGEQQDMLPDDAQQQSASQHSSDSQ